MHVHERIREQDAFVAAVLCRIRGLRAVAEVQRRAHGDPADAVALKVAAKAGLGETLMVTVRTIGPGGMDVAGGAEYVGGGGDGATGACPLLL